MMKLHAHNRLHIPNKLAIFAAFLLLISSVVNLNDTQDGYDSNQQATPSVQVKSADKDGVETSVDQKRRGLNLGLLLFRRG